MALNLSQIFLELCDAFFRNMNCLKELIVIYFVSVFILLSGEFSLHKFNYEKKISCTFLKLWLIRESMAEVLIVW